ncbi:MAG: hypothetical protein OHK0013_04220 [Sandaracinaceae bacterium]
MSAPDDAPAAAGSTPAAAPGPEGPDVAVYKRRALIGTIALVLRTAFAQLVILGGTIVLARHLRPSDFGVFAMVQFVLTVLTLVGDAGLGGALVQKKTTPTQRELSTVFFAQMALGAMVLVVASAIGEVLPSVWPELPEGTPWILRALALNFVLTSARVVPTLLLERELHFVRVSILDTVSSTTFYLVAATLALEGAGVWALVLGVLGQGAAGLVTALALRPWRPSLTFDATVVRGLLGFGLPYQARSGLVLLTRSSIPVVGGSLLGSHAVGLLNWALETSFFPLTFVEILARVSFPLYSRMQSAPDALAREIERSVRLAASITLFLTGMFVGLAPQLTEVIYSAQWLEAVPMLRLYAVAIAFGMLVFVLAPAFDAAGKPRVVMVQMLIVAVCVWAFAAAGTHVAGAVGFVVGYTIALALGAAIIVHFARRELPRVRLVQPFAATTIGSVVVVAVGHFVLGPHANAPVPLFFSVVFEIALFIVVVGVLDRDTLAALRSTLPRKTANAPAVPSPP